MWRVPALFILLLLSLACIAAPAKKPAAKPPAKQPAAAQPTPPAPTPFTAFSPTPNFPLPEIVLPYDPETKTGANWAEVNRPQWFESSAPVLMGRAAQYVREGLQRMTGQEYPVASKTDLSKGIVLTLLKWSGDSIRKDAEVLQALKADAKDQYAANEAFFIRSEKNRLLVVANTPNGLLAGVAELLELAGYEILGMGPNWIYAPDYRNKPLTFAVKRAGRPSFYIRGLGVTSGQGYGVGTIMGKLPDPADEGVDVSHWRWQIGARIYGTSMPGFPGHALQSYHKAVLQHMKANTVTEGFMSPKTVVAPDAQRPAADKENAGWLWINSDPDGQPANQVFISDGKSWVLQAPPGYTNYNIDPSVPFVRQIIFDAMKASANNAFTKQPEELFVFGIDPEDGGGYAALDKLMQYQHWYPEYLKQEGVPFGRPYILHKYNGLNQPNEIWDPTAASDTVFGLANYLLREFDKWIDSLPAEQRVTATGQRKKDLVRCSFYSYNFHDVPPNFNLDPRIRVMIASYPKHRGRGKWEKFASQEDMARAFKVMLPREPSGDYRIISISYYADLGAGGVPMNWSAAPQDILQNYRQAYNAGYRAINHETDFNFGKMGLAYYLIAKTMWNINLTEKELDAIRDRWFQRAFGSGWREMKAYYNFMLQKNYPVNGPNSWAKAIRFIDAADKKVDPAKEADAQRRIDNVKEYWYFLYLQETGKDKNSRELKEFAWKGQMSYMTAMHIVTRRLFATNSPKEAAGPEFANGPAHYTREETQQWWSKMLDRWKVVPVVMFSDTTLANGKPAKSVDLNDLVMVKEFQNGAADSPFYYNSGYQKPVPFLLSATRKDEVIGFSLSWPYTPGDTGYQRPRKVPYGVDIWNPVKRVWEAWIDKTMTEVQSVEKANEAGKLFQVVEVQLKAPRAGAYRFDIGYGGNGASLASYAYDPLTGKYAAPAGFTYFSMADGLTQSPVYFYIPKGATTIDFEIWDTHKGKTLHLYKGGLPAQKPALSRKVDVSAMGTHTVALQPGEDGTVAMLQSNGFAFPFVYSVPTLWAKSPGALLIPRGIAEADGLTIVK